MKTSHHQPSSFSVFFVVLLLGLGGCQEQPTEKPPKPVIAFEIADPNRLSETRFPGLAIATKEANLSFRVSGPIVDIPIKIGDNIARNSKVAQIDQNDFQRMLDNASAILDGAKAANQRAEADYERLRNAQIEDSGATSQRAVDFAKSQRDETRAAVASASATVQAAKDRLSYTTLRAPFDGKLVETYVENYETVVAFQPILRVVDSREIKMTLSVPENLIGYVQYVTQISVSFDALPNEVYEANISEIGSEASQITRTYPVTLQIRQDKEGRILPGMAGQAVVSAMLPDSKQNNILIPASALFAGKTANESAVWVIENNQLTERHVEVIGLADNSVVITKGVSAGEKIVRAGVSALYEGQAVRIIENGVR